MIFSFWVIMMMLCSVSLAGARDESLSDEEIVMANLPSKILLGVGDIAVSLGEYCARLTILRKSHRDCPKVDHIISLLSFEFSRRKTVDSYIELLNKKKSENTVKQIRQAEEFVFKYGTRDEKDRVAY